MPQIFTRTAIPPWYAHGVRPCHRLDNPRKSPTLPAVTPRPHPLGCRRVPAPGPEPPFDPDWLDGLLRRFLEEDVGPGDRTTAACIDPQAGGRGRIRCREAATVAGV
ncbi:MAG: hypothetical protein D6739_09525, partial [Nitrospirae bacterium]